MERDKKSERLKALQAALGQIKKEFGDESIHIFGEKTGVPKVEVISTGALTLDVATGIGGVPRGRVIEIFGPEASGKTTLALHIIAEAQKSGGVAAYIDAEHALDVNYAKNIGVNLDELLISQPDSGEEALSIAERLVRSGAVDVVVIDSVAALIPKQEIEGEMGDQHVGIQARLMSQAIRKLTAAVSKSKSVLIFINQIRMKIGVMFGNPETTPGGLALKFASSMRFDIRGVERIKSGDDIVGNRVRVIVVKNKLASPHRRAEFDIIYSKGILKETACLMAGEEMGVVKKQGNTYIFNETKLGVGLEQAKKFLSENPKIMSEIEKKVIEKLKS